MATTQLFVELLVIGTGVIAWMFLFVAAAFGWPLSPHVVTFDAGELLVVSAMAYILGIMLDRISRALWDMVLCRPENIDKTPTDEAVNLICSESAPLWNTCVYNRSRLRICRAWTLNFVLLAISYTEWNARVHAHPRDQSTAIVSVALMLCALAAWATVRLNCDYYIQITRVLPLVRKCSSPLPEVDNPGESPCDSQIATTPRSVGICGGNRCKSRVRDIARRG